ncbi:MULTISPECIES: DNA cytosine methyltransferase [unclassified Microcoleus]|uniref:DNA cytosine methyltransferase n=1 Tax=unclassified Microcoleus TaxID=2642155 RepID=UPI002FD09464
MQAISLFSGIGGFELAAQLVFGDDVPSSKLRYQTFQFVEINPYAQKVLQSHFPNIPIWSDINTYHPPKLRQLGFPTIVIGGFPCTNTSNAGKKEGLAGAESGLWWEMYRVIVEAQPDFVIIENPKGIIYRGLRTILGALRMAGFEAEVEVISASECGAVHERQRVFIVAYLHDLQLQQRKGWQSWTNSLRANIEAARSFVTYPETQPRIMPLDASNSNYLAGLHYENWWKFNSPPANIGLPRNTPGRAEAITLTGLSICVPQATVPLMRLQFLAHLLSNQHIRRSN